MKRTYLITAFVLVAFAAFVARESLGLRFYTPLGPGPGFFPFFLALSLGGLGVVMGLQAALGGTEPAPANFFTNRSGYLRMASVVLTIGAIAGLLESLGFRVTMLAATVYILWAFGRPSPLVIAIVSLVGSFGVFHVFVRWLNVPLPIGALGF